MTDKQEQNQEPANPPEPDAEEAYWTKFEGKLDSWFEKKKKELTTQGTSRTGGRSTLPKVLANLMGGPFTPSE